ncbi:hypothetical protein [Pseudoalteromonas spongiae]|uniref:hypothetical protein n=1 Tax=Pseudoalteromonas spongiae TaxID=298657 RepID=UPI00110B1A58|nr:hypothetical protein [Pseudoalteromonas spongiae]TMO84677.1 hypothetical protein CWC15_10355 [Pseudoalteromonas spongiae]
MNMQLSREELTMLLSDSNHVDTVNVEQNDELSSLITRFEGLQLELHNLLCCNVEKGDKAALLQQLNRLTTLNDEFINELNH